MTAPGGPLRDAGGGDLVALLPHRAPMLLLDAAARTADGALDARQTIPAAGAIVAGHFPGFAVWPGALLLEAMAQTTAAYLLGERRGLGADELPVLGSVEGRFLRPVFPGETIDFHTELVRRIGDLALFTVTARRGGEVVGRARIASGVRRRETLHPAEGAR
jgi:3-hydroxyacyl-[acyl-carrier-protein] dehydratase